MKSRAPLWVSVGMWWGIGAGAAYAQGALPPPATTPTPAAPTPAAPPAAPTTPAERVAVTFSKLLFRVEKEDEIGVAKHDYRVFILEDLRARGFNAVGAENLVFEKDDSDRADYVLGGTVREVKCRERAGKIANCYLGIEWELLDTQRDEVVYKALARHAVLELDKETSPSTIGKRLVLGNLDRLLARAQLKALLLAGPVARQARKPDYPEAALRACGAGAPAMPADADKALAATVLIEARGVGSGFLISPDGLVLTAAHVVSTTHPTVTMRDGSRFTADVLRVSRDHDVALLRIPVSQALPCLPLVLTPSKPGEEIYAIGAPAGKQLGFSLTRGIVSGLRDFDGVQFVQTDASVSPGNSGGPLVAATGGAVGVVSWKVQGSAVEGVAFAAPSAMALSALSLKIGEHSDPWLLSAPAEAAEARESKPVVDATDPVPSLDPKGDRLRAERAREEARDRKLAAMTPAYVPLLRWGGVAVAVGGAVGVIASVTSFDSEYGVTHDEYESARLSNDLSWAAVGLGGALFVTSFVLAPSLPAEQTAKPAARANMELDVGLGAVQLRGRY